MPRWPANYKKKHPERNYKKEAKTEAGKEQTKDRVARTLDRRKFEKEGKVHKGDGKEIDHKVPIGGKANKNNYKDSNLQVIPRSENRKKQPKRK
jgi:hypothetical protein